MAPRKKTPRKQRLKKRRQQKHFKRRMARIALILLKQA